MRRRRLLPLLVSIAAVVFLVVGVFPTRSYFAQRAAIARAEDRLAEISTENARLDGRVDALGTDAEIEHIAREQYNLVLPGEEAYAILPPPSPRPDALPIPDAWPFRGLADDDESDE